MDIILRQAKKSKANPIYGIVIEIANNIRFSKFDNDGEIVNCVIREHWDMFDGYESSFLGVVAELNGNNEKRT